MGAELMLRCSQVYKAMRRHVQECAVKILRNVNKDELTNFQRVGQLRACTLHCPILVLAFIMSAAQCHRLRGCMPQNLPDYNQHHTLTELVLSL